MAYRRTEKVLQHLAARQAAILGAARTIASEQGMGGVQIAPVAARARVAAGTVYRYFPSKTELVAALISSLAESEIASMRKAADAAPGPLSALSAAIATFAMRAAAHRRLAWAVLAEPVDASVDASRLRFRRALAAEIAGRMTAAIAGGFLPKQDVGEIAPAIVGALIEGLIGPLAASHDDIDRARDEVRALTLFALRAVGVVDARARGLVVQTALS